ncbi:MAG: hypothetical protein HN396_18630 [Gemmatimonadales bacterium]|nr:hypothetical protein [Gemmatimonadales bacterium]
MKKVARMVETASESIREACRGFIGGPINPRTLENLQLHVERALEQKGWVPEELRQLNYRTVQHGSVVQVAWNGSVTALMACGDDRRRLLMTDPLYHGTHRQIRQLELENSEGSIVFALVEALELACKERNRLARDLAKASMLNANPNIFVVKEPT